jgi:NAD/NADP transhydrogenase beta subunit
MDARSAGLAIVLLGIAAVVIGLIAMTGALSWFGRLPGDIRYSSGSTRVFIPITTMILVSVVLSVALAIFRRWL